MERLTSRPDVRTERSVRKGVTPRSVRRCTTLAVGSDPVGVRQQRHAVRHRGAADADRSDAGARAAPPSDVPAVIDRLGPGAPHSPPNPDPTAQCRRWRNRPSRDDPVTCCSPPALPKGAGGLQQADCRPCSGARRSGRPRALTGPAPAAGPARGGRSWRRRLPRSARPRFATVCGLH